VAQRVFLKDYGIIYKEVPWEQGAKHSLSSTQSIRAAIGSPDQKPFLSSAPEVMAYDRLFISIKQNRRELIKLVKIYQSGLWITYL